MSVLRLSALLLVIMSAVTAQNLRGLQVASGCPMTFEDAVGATCTTDGVNCSYNFVKVPKSKGNGGACSNSEFECVPMGECQCGGGSYGCMMRSMAECTNGNPDWAYTSCTP